MSPLPWKSVFAAWLAILVLAFGNGALRELWLRPAFGTPYALWLSGVLLIAAILLVTRGFARHLDATTLSQRWLIGTVWLLLTLGFEFGMGVAQGRSPAELIAPYRFADGNLWPLVLLATVTAPVLVLRGRR